MVSNSEVSADTTAIRQYLLPTIHWPCIPSNPDWRFANEDERILIETTALRTNAFIQMFTPRRTMHHCIARLLIEHGKLHF